MLTLLKARGQDVDSLKNVVPERLARKLHAGFKTNFLTGAFSPPLSIPGHPTFGEQAATS